MSKKALIFIGAIILLIAAAFTFVLINPAPSPVANEVMESPEGDTATEPEPSQEVVDQPGIYTEYTEDGVLNTPGTKLLFFHAPWCLQCRQIEDSIVSDGLPNGVTVFKIDYDSNQALRQKYGVTLQTTFVKVDDQGNKISSYVAYDEPRFSSVERELLQ